MMNLNGPNYELKYERPRTIYIDCEVIFESYVVFCIETKNQNSDIRAHFSRERQRAGNLPKSTYEKTAAWGDQVGFRGQRS